VSEKKNKIKKMELFDSFTNILSLLFGGSLISIVTWKFARSKAAAEAKQAEAVAKQAEADAEKAKAEAIKERQDYYQQLVTDIASDRDYYKHERDEYRETIKGYDVRIDALERTVARNGRMVESMRPFTCADLSCKLRKRVIISEEGEVKKPRQKNTDIEPVDRQDL
jgi:flagellar biosynthesis/type III secretory pathway M-ring protein FliF/YscJ